MGELLDIGAPREEGPEVEPASSRFRFVDRLTFGRVAWDAFVEATDEGWLWHRFELQDALCTWPSRRDLSFAVLDSAARGHCVAVVPAHLWSRRIAGVWRWAAVDSLGGPACRTDLPERQRRALCNAIGSFMVGLANRHRAGEISFAISALTPSVRGENLPRVNPLLYLGCRNTSTQSWVVDLRTDEGRVWARLEGRARTEIRKAERAGVSIRPVGKSDDLEQYYKLHRLTCGRSGIRPHPRAYFEAIWRGFLANQLAQIFMAEHEGEIVAAANFAIYKRGALYWTGAAAERGLGLGANALLQWHAIQWMLREGLEWYETGEAFPNLKTGKLKQLSDFKKSFGGALYPYYRGQILVSPRMYAVLRFAKDFLRPGRSP